MKKVSEISKEEELRALEIYRRSIVIDPVNMPYCSLTRDYIERTVNAGVTSLVAHLQSPRGGLSFDYAETFQIIYEYLTWIEGNPDKAILIKKAEDIEKAKKEGKTAFTIALHNARSIESFRFPEPNPSVMMLTLFNKLGVKLVGLTRHDRNWLADGCQEPKDCGLSRFGIQCVEEMNRLGIVMDLSHVGRRSTLETIELSKDPCVFTHANIKKIASNPRNKTDEEIKALAEKGGVICITGLSFVAFTKDTALQPVKNLAEAEKVRPTLDDFLVHLNYAVDLVGADYVAVGSDLADGTPGYKNFIKEYYGSGTPYPSIELPFTRVHHKMAHVKDFDSIDTWPNVAKALVAGGYSDQEIQKILGGNLQRVFKRVWG